MVRFSGTARNLTGKCSTTGGIRRNDRSEGKGGKNEEKNVKIRVVKGLRYLSEIPLATA
jgi:hypothetical protein